MLRSIEKSITRPCWRRSSGTSPMPAAIAAVGDPGGSDLPAISTDPASQRSIPKIARATSVRPAPTSPASATISPLRTSKETSVKTPSRVSRSTFSTTSPGSVGTFGKSASMSRPTIARITDCVVSSSTGFVRTCRPSRITVTRWQIAKISSSRWETKSTALPCVAQRLDDAEQPVDLRARQRSRRLVHHDHSRVRRQRLRDLDELLVGDREPASQPVGVEPDAELLEHGGRLAAHPPAVDAAEPLERLHADEDVLGDGQVGEERRLLEDDRDPGRLRLLGVVEDRLLAVEQETARRRAGGRRRGS